MASICLALSLALAFWAMLIATIGRAPIRSGPLHFSSPRLVPVVLATLVLAVVAHRAAGNAIEATGLRLASIVQGGAPATAVLLSLLVMVGALRLGSQVAGGADCYGYLSQAELWREGRVVQVDPLAVEMANRLPTRMFAPLGYTVGRPGSIVPTYPAGLPLLIAAASWLVGREGVFVVVPICAGLTVALTFVLGTLIGGRITGLASATLLATAPSFVALALQPMSDVPAAAGWTAALTLALLARGRGGASPAAFARERRSSYDPTCCPLPPPLPCSPRARALSTDSAASAPSSRECSRR